MNNHPKQTKKKAQTHTHTHKKPTQNLVFNKINPNAFFF